MQPPKVKTAAKGDQPLGGGARLEMRKFKPNEDSLDGYPVQDLTELEADIAAAEEYERFLGLKAYRVRKLILNLRVRREALADLGRALWGGAA